MNKQPGANHTLPHSLFHILSLQRPCIAAQSELPRGQQGEKVQSKSNFVTMIDDLHQREGFSSFVSPSPSPLSPPDVFTPIKLDVLPEEPESSGWRE